MKLSKFELIDAVQTCMTDCNKSCPLYYYAGDCVQSILNALTRDLPTVVTDEPKMTEPSYDHDWDVDLSTHELNLTSEDPEFDACMPRTAFIERDHILDEIGEAKEVIDAIEYAWGKTKEFAKNRVKNILHNQLKQLDWIQEHPEVFNDDELEEIFKAQDDEFEDEKAGFAKAQVRYEEDLKDAQIKLDALKEKLALWDKTHDAKTGEFIGMLAADAGEGILLSEELYPRDAKIEDELHKGAAALVEALWSDGLDKKFEDGADVISFGDFLELMDDTNLSPEEIEDAKNIKTKEDLIEWLIK